MPPANLEQGFKSDAENVAFLKSLAVGSTMGPSEHLGVRPGDPSPAPLTFLTVTIIQYMLLSSLQIILSSV